MPLAQWRGLNEANLTSTDTSDDNEKDSFEAQESNIKAHYERALRLLAASTTTIAGTSAQQTRRPFASAFAPSPPPQDQLLHDDAYQAFGAVLDEPLIRRVIPQHKISDSDNDPATGAKKVALPPLAYSVKSLCLKHMANILVLRNDLKGALAHLIDAILLDDRNLLVWRIIGETAAAMGDNHLARLAFETLATSRPADASTLRSLMSVNGQLGDARATFEAAQRVSVLEPHNLWQHRVTQKLYLQLVSPQVIGMRRFQGGDGQQQSLAENLEYAIEEQFNACPMLSSVLARSSVDHLRGDTNASNMLSNISDKDKNELNNATHVAVKIDAKLAAWASLLRTLVEVANERMENGQSLSICVDFGGDVCVANTEQQPTDVDVDMDESEGLDTQETIEDEVRGSDESKQNENKKTETDLSPTQGGKGSKAKGKKRGRGSATSQQSQPRRSTRRTGSSSKGPTSRAAARRENLHVKLWKLVCKYNVVQASSEARNIDDSTSSSRPIRSFREISAWQENVCVQKYPCFAMICSAKALQNSRGAVADSVNDIRQRGASQVSAGRSLVDLEEQEGGAYVNENESKEVMHFVNSLGSVSAEGEKRSVMLLSVLLDVVVHVSGMFAADSSADDEVDEELGDLVLEAYQLLKRHNVIRSGPLGGLLARGRGVVDLRELSVALLAGESCLDIAGRDSTDRERAIELLKVCDSCVAVLSSAVALLLHNNQTKNDDATQDNYRIIVANPNRPVVDNVVVMQELSLVARTYWLIGRVAALRDSLEPALEALSLCTRALELRDALPSSDVNIMPSVDDDDVDMEGTAKSKIKKKTEKKGGGKGESDKVAVDGGNGYVDSATGESRELRLPTSTADHVLDVEMVRAKVAMLRSSNTARQARHLMHKAKTAAKAFKLKRIAQRKQADRVASRAATASNSAVAANIAVINAANDGFVSIVGPSTAIPIQPATHPVTNNIPIDVLDDPEVKGLYESVLKTLTDRFMPDTDLETDMTCTRVSFLKEIVKDFNSASLAAEGNRESTRGNTQRIDLGENRNNKEPLSSSSSSSSNTKDVVLNLFICCNMLGRSELFVSFAVHILSQLLRTASVSNVPQRKGVYVNDTDAQRSNVTRVSSIVSTSSVKGHRPGFRMDPSLCDLSKHVLSLLSQVPEAVAKVSSQNSSHENHKTFFVDAIWAAIFLGEQLVSVDVIGMGCELAQRSSCSAVAADALMVVLTTNAAWWVTGSDKAPMERQRGNMLLSLLQFAREAREFGRVEEKHYFGQSIGQIIVNVERGLTDESNADEIQAWTALVECSANFLATVEERGGGTAQWQKELNESLIHSAVKTILSACEIQRKFVCSVKTINSLLDILGAPGTEGAERVRIDACGVYAQTLTDPRLIIALQQLEVSGDDSGDDDDEEDSDDSFENLEENRQDCLDACMSYRFGLDLFGTANTNLCNQPNGGQANKSGGLSAGSSLALTMLNAGDRTSDELARLFAFLLPYLVAVREMKNKVVESALVAVYQANKNRINAGPFAEVIRNFIQPPPIGRQQQQVVVSSGNDSGFLAISGSEIIDSRNGSLDVNTNGSLDMTRDGHIGGNVDIAVVDVTDIADNTDTDVVMNGTNADTNNNFSVNSNDVDVVLPEVVLAPPSALNDEDEGPSALLETERHLCYFLANFQGLPEVQVRKGERQDEALDRYRSDLAQYEQLVLHDLSHNPWRMDSWMNLTLFARKCTDQLLDEPLALRPLMEQYAKLSPQILPRAERTTPSIPEVSRQYANADSLQTKIDNTGVLLAAERVKLERAAMAMIAIVSKFLNKEGGNGYESPPDDIDDVNDDQDIVMLPVNSCVRARFRQGDEWYDATIVRARRIDMGNMLGLDQNEGVDIESTSMLVSEKDKKSKRTKSGAKSTRQRRAKGREGDDDSGLNSEQLVKNGTKSVRYDLGFLDGEADMWVDSKLVQAHKFAAPVHLDVVSDYLVDVLEMVGVANYTEMHECKRFGNVPKALRIGYKCVQGFKRAAEAVEASSGGDKVGVRQLAFLRFMQGKSLEKVNAEPKEWMPVYRAALDAMGTGEHRRDILYRVHASRLKIAFKFGDPCNNAFSVTDADWDALESLRFADMPEASSTGNNGSLGTGLEPKGWLSRVTGLIWLVSAAAKQAQISLDDTGTGDKLDVIKKRAEIIKLHVIADAMQAMLYCCKTSTHDHRAVHRLAKAVVQVGKLGVGQDLSTALASLIMHTLFDKKRAQIVSVWMPDSAVDFGQFAQRIYKFDGYRLKYTAVYTDLLFATGEFKRLHKLWHTLMTRKERDNYALQLCSRLCLDAMVRHLESSLTHRKRLAFGGSTSVSASAGSSASSLTTPMSESTGTNHGMSSANTGGSMITSRTILDRAHLVYLEALDSQMIKACGSAIFCRALSDRVKRLLIASHELAYSELHEEIVGDTVGAGEPVKVGGPGEGGGLLVEMAGGDNTQSSTFSAHSIHTEGGSVVVVPMRALFVRVLGHCNELWPDRRGSMKVSKSKLKLKAQPPRPVDPIV